MSNFINNTLAKGFLNLSTQVAGKVLRMGGNRHACNIFVGTDHLEDLVLDGRLMLSGFLRNSVGNVW
jgi:hypothetical protein